MNITRPTLNIICPRLPDAQELQAGIRLEFNRLSPNSQEIEHQYITNSLFVNLGAPPRHRPFIGVQIPEGWWATINGFNYFLTEDEVNDLTDAIDELAPTYINASREVEKRYRTLDFSCSPTSYFRLIKVARSLWDRMLTFANQHDYDSGESSWHIFDRNDFFLNILQDGKRKAFIRSEQHVPGLEKSIVSDPLRYADEEVWLCWDKFLMLNVAQRFNPDAWNAEETYLWLRERFIPHLSQRQNVFQSLRSDVMRTLENILAPPTFTPGTAITEITSFGQLHQAIQEMQSFYVVESKTFIESRHMELACDLVVYLLNQLSLAEGTCNYANEKLNLEASRGNPEISLAWWRQQQKGENLETILRVVLVFVREGRPRTQEAIITSYVVDALAPLWEHYTDCTYVQRMATLS